MKRLVLFNNKGGVGKTTLSYHLAYMLARLGHRTLVLDYDPQANLTSMFIEDEHLFANYASLIDGTNVAGCLEPVRRGKGELRSPRLVPIEGGLWLLPGHLGLGQFEQVLAEEWPKKTDTNNERALDVTTALDQLCLEAGKVVDAEYAIVDVGPSLGALNRAALLACDAIVFPLAPDLFSLQGLVNVGPNLEIWRSDWNYVRKEKMKGRAQENLPHHEFRPIGYIVQQHLARSDRPVAAYNEWAQKIPDTYRKHILLDKSPEMAPDLEKDSNCIGTVKHYASLIPLAQQARKPVFDLKHADGAGGGHVLSVRRSQQLFEGLCQSILVRLENPSSAIAS